MDLISNSSERLILALDGMDKSEAFKLISQIPTLKWVKVGLELFITEGPQVVWDLRAKGLKVFLDLKLHDIPATMIAASKKAAQTGAELITVHACAGKESLLKANFAAKETAYKLGFQTPKLLAVTVLTSWDNETFSKDLRIDQPIDERVEVLAALAKDAGLAGCVCSAWELLNLRKLFPDEFELVTPGIRDHQDKSEDQIRVMSPSEAINGGASRIVVGRPITKSKKPFESFQYFCKEIDDC